MTAANRSLAASLSASMSASVRPFSLEAPALEGPFLAAGFAFCCLEGLAVGFDFGCLAAGFRSSSSSEALPSHSSSPSSLEESMVRFAFGMALYVGEDRAEKGARARARREAFALSEGFVADDGVLQGRQAGRASEEGSSASTRVAGQHFWVSISRASSHVSWKGYTRTRTEFDA